MNFTDQEKICGSGALGNVGTLTVLECSTPEQDHERLTTCVKVKMLMCNATWVSLVASLCSLFFVVTGIQLWATNYFEKYFGQASSTVALTFLFVAATGPTIGVIAGGLLIDSKYIGGFVDLTTQRRAMIVSSVFGGIATLCGTVAGFLSADPDKSIPATNRTNFFLCATLIWLVLLFGGAMLPGATGVLLHAVKPEIRAFANAMAMMLYNIFGYMLGCFVPGVIMDALTPKAILGVVDPKSEHMRYGMQCIFAWSCIGIVGCLITIWDLSRKIKQEDARKIKEEARTSKRASNAEKIEEESKNSKYTSDV